MKTKLVFLGPPGVGKGTIAAILSKKMGISHISSGDIFREHINKQTPLGKIVQETINKGDLVPDDITIRIMKDRLKQKDCGKGFILDGFPRTIPQAEALKKITKLDAVINFVASKKNIIERIDSRITCSKCGAVFNIITNKPKKKGVCDNCRTRLVKREDQKPEVIKERLTVYNKQTKPLVEYYKKQKLLININAEPEVEEVFENIKKALL